MTQERVIQLLLKKSGSENTYDCPSLIPEACGLIAKELSSIITDTLKYKSSVQSNKRLNILKFLRNSYGFANYHTIVDEQNVVCIMKAMQIYLEGDKELKLFQNESEKEYEEISQDMLQSKLLDFYKHKNAKRKERNKLLDTIKKYDQEKILSSNHNFQVEKPYSSYETNENLVTILLDPIVRHNLKTNNSFIENYDYRQKQINFCYALMNLEMNEDILRLFKDVLHKLESYKDLQTNEINFIKYLFLHGDQQLLETAELVQRIVRSFMFIIEQQLISLILPVLEINEEVNVLIYCDSLTKNIFFSKLKILCSNNSELHSIILNIIYTLYQYSFCNINILLLCKLL